MDEELLTLHGDRQIYVDEPLLEIVLFRHHLQFATSILQAGMQAPFL